MIINYMRVSSRDQNEDRQRDALPEADEIFIDKTSGKNRERKALEEMLVFVRKGDEVHCHSLDRMARNLRDLQDIVDKIISKGASVQFHKENLTFSNGANMTAMNKLLFHLLGAFAEFEGTLISERQAEGVMSAKERGVKFGRKKLLTDAQIEEIRHKKEAGANPSQLAREYAVSRATIYNALA